GGIRTPTAGMDLGSNNFKPIEKPNILLMVGEDTRAYDAGEVWHLLDYRMRIPVVLYDKHKLNSLDIGEYTHIIFVGGSYNANDEALSRKMKNWVRAGGTVIAHRQGAKWAGEILLGIKDEKEEYPLERQDYADKIPNEVENIVGGAIMRGDLDNTHPIGFGYHSRDVYTHRDTLIAFDKPKNPYATVVEIPKIRLSPVLLQKTIRHDLPEKQMLLLNVWGKVLSFYLPITQISGHIFTDQIKCS
ncbi:MAG: hypothetical protein P8O77_03580, partial [Emcibacteraceae bacterium]|nr:hypothetical protein [Emcibacteraceae bacterium]